MSGAVSRARQILKDTQGAFMPSQFANPNNPVAHEQGTALEIIEQTSGSIAAFVSGVGTGGTITGVGRVLRSKFGKNVLIVGVEPTGSAVLSGKAPGMHGIQGIGAGFIPEILERNVIDRVVEVSDVAAERMVRRLAREEGFLVGPSSGANVHVACDIAGEVGKGNVVTLLCDSGERYLF
jgi:cysteine synthase A